jgi:cobyrinic acid a,c-diamide synthase
MNAQPRLVVSAPSSGHGKTAIAVGLLAAAVARGVPAAGFKVGPDHTDAAYLGLAAGRPGRNLDPRLVGAHRIAPLFAHGAAGAQLAVIEGSMGLFDSLTGQPEIDGTAAVAAVLRAPVVLVVDVAAMGHSIAALVHGFRMFDEMVHLGGVILNRIASPRHEEMLRTALDDIGMPVLGALRRGDLPNVLPARAHGPVPVAHRTVEASRAVRRLGEAVAGGLDLDRLVALANSAPALPGPLWTPAEAIGGEPFDQRPVIALAGGPGAPYTYVETAELLTAAGADVAVVDPLRDETLPAGTRALVVGAGLPEGYAEELSANRRLCETVAKFAASGWPVVAEGVALPWLGCEFDGRPMCGVLDASAYTGDQTVAGYREATAPTTSALAPAGARITGYKQHRAVVTPRAGAVPAWTWSGGNPEGFVWRQVHASQLGLHWAAAPEIAKRVVAAAIAGPVSLQQPPLSPQSSMSQSSMSQPSVLVSQPPMAGPSGPSPMLVPAGMPSAGVGPASEMPSQVSGPDFGPPPMERGDFGTAAHARVEHRGALFGSAPEVASFSPGSEVGSYGPGSEVVSYGPGSEVGLYGPGSEVGERGLTDFDSPMPPRSPAEFGPPNQSLGERVAAEFGSGDYGAPERQPVDYGPPNQGAPTHPERPAEYRTPNQGVPANPERRPAEYGTPNQGAPTGPERRPAEFGPTSSGANLGDTVDIIAP